MIPLHTRWQKLLPSGGAIPKEAQSFFSPGFLWTRLPLNDNSDKVVFAKIVGKIADATASTEDGIIEFHVQEAGSNTSVIQIKGDGIHIMSGKQITFGDGTTMSSAPTMTETDPTAVTMAIALG